MPQTLSDFDTLVRTHSREIHNYLWRMLQDQQDAEDALQDCFLRALRAFPRLAPDSNQRAWLFKIATNVALTRLKQRSWLAARTSDLDPALQADHQSDHGQTTRIAVRQAVESLPTKQRAALVLRYYQGLEYTQIGQILDCSAESARANLHQALQKLRQRFKEETV
jgi:RNA polymerase sigma factor (sigma-70 family)